MTDQTLRAVRRQLRTWPLVALIYFSVSGGPYGLEDAISSSGAGMTLVLLIAVPILFSVPCAMMTAELGSALPLEGGYYAWVKIGLGRFWGYLEGMLSWITSWLDTALYPVLFVDYLATWVPDLQRGRHVAVSLWDGTFSVDLHWLVAFAFMIPLAWLNIRGSKLVGDTSLVFLALILAPFVVVAIIGIHHWVTTPGVNPLQPFVAHGLDPRQAAGAGLAVVIWNYIGFDAVSTVGGEMENPRRTFPLALLISVPLIMLTYIVPVVASLAAGIHGGHTGRWTNGDFAVAGYALGGPWLQAGVVVGAIVSQVGLFSALLMSGSRIPAVLAADHYLPEPLARVNPRTGTPVNSILLMCAIFAVFIGLDFSSLIDADVTLSMIALVLEFAALIVLRRRFPRMARPYRVPGGMVGAVAIAIVPVFLSWWLLKSMLYSEPVAFWLSALLIAGSVVLYPVLRRYVKRGRPDGELDSTGVDFGPGIDADAVIRGVRTS